MQRTAADATVTAAASLVDAHSFLTPSAVLIRPWAIECWPIAVAV